MQISWIFNICRRLVKFILILQERSLKYYSLPNRISLSACIFIYFFILCTCTHTSSKRKPKENLRRWRGIHPLQQHHPSLAVSVSPLAPSLCYLCSFETAPVTDWQPRELRRDAACTPAWCACQPPPLHLCFQPPLVCEAKNKPGTSSSSRSLMTSRSIVGRSHQTRDAVRCVCLCATRRLTYFIRLVSSDDIW